MEYNFYGWEAAKNVVIENEKYRGIKTPLDLYDILSGIWCRETCAPRLRDGWSEDNKTKGQCSITAFLVQDIFGGEVYGIKTRDGIHCYNVVEGNVFDLTSEQFGEDAKNLVYEGNEKQYRNSPEHFEKKEKKERYRYLEKELKEYLISRIFNF